MTFFRLPLSLTTDAPRHRIFPLVISSYRKAFHCPSPTFPIFGSIAPARLHREAFHFPVPIYPPSINYCRHLLQATIWERTELPWQMATSTTCGADPLGALVYEVVGTVSDVASLLRWVFGPSQVWSRRRCCSRTGCRAWFLTWSCS